MIVNVKEIVNKKKEELKEKIERLKRIGTNPKLAVILASDDPASLIYVSKKRNMCSELGINEVEYIYDNKSTTEEIIEKINELNNDKNVSGILVQLPLFDKLDTEKILYSIKPNKDVDGLHPLNMGKLFSSNSGLVSCTPKGIMMILDELGTEYTGKHAVVVGRSNLVGKPVAQLLLSRNCTVTNCHSKTLDLKKYTKEADILVVAVGKENLITRDMIKRGATVIDVGINRNKDNKVVGDCDTKAIENKAKYITPVPGGIGLTTVLSLLQNVTEAAENIEK